MLATLILACQQEWVVKDVLPPQPQDPGVELTPTMLGVCGDLDMDSCADGYMLADDFPSTRDLIRIYWGPSAAQAVQLDGGRLMFVKGGPTFPTIALVNSPLGRLVIAGEAAFNYSLTARLIRNPTLPIVISPSAMPLAFTRADDLNGDGWEEIFFQDFDGARASTGLLDGRTLTTLWKNSYSGYYYVNMVSRNESGPLQDMDGDLTSDFVAGWSTYAPATGQWGSSVMALSGRDGSLLWENRDSLSTGVFVFPATSHDLTGDGVQDVVIANASVIKAISGSSGTTLWTFDPIPVLQAAAPAGWNYLELANPCMLTINPVGGSLEMVVAVRFWQYLGGFSSFRMDLAAFDPYSGAFLGLAVLPQTLTPWFSDPLQVPTPDAHAFALGDQDRDGVQEIAFLADAPNYDLVANGSTVKHIVTLGMKTLEVPPQAQIGTYFPAAVSIPSAPLYDFVWIASRGFDRRSGAVLDGWVTNLAPTSLLTSTWTSRAFAGALDAAGRGQVQIPIPADPNLVGTRLYSRAVVLAPGGQEIWTLSTLGITDLVP